MPYGFKAIWVKSTAPNFIMYFNLKKILSCIEKLSPLFHFCKLFNITRFFSEKPSNSLPKLVFFSQTIDFPLAKKQLLLLFKLFSRMRQENTKKVTSVPFLLAETKMQIFLRLNFGIFER